MGRKKDRLERDEEQGRGRGKLLCWGLEKDRGVNGDRGEARESKGRGNDEKCVVKEGILRTGSRNKNDFKEEHFSNIR